MTLSALNASLSGAAPHVELPRDLGVKSAGGARFAGRDHMLSALKTLQAIHEGGADIAGAPQPAFQALKISGKSSGLLALFASHPPLEERIARLEHPSAD